MLTSYTYTEVEIHVLKFKLFQEKYLQVAFKCKLSARTLALFTILQPCFGVEVRLLGQSNSVKIVGMITQGRPKIV